MARYPDAGGLMLHSLEQQDDQPYGQCANRCLAIGLSYFDPIKSFRHHVSRRAVTRQRPHSLTGVRDGVAQAGKHQTYHSPLLGPVRARLRPAARCPKQAVLF